MRFILSFTILFIFLTITLYSQTMYEELDPFMGDYVLGNSAEILTAQERILNISDFASNAISPDPVYNDVDSHSKIRDLASGDFNGDLREECAMAIYSYDNSPGVNTHSLSIRVIGHTQVDGFSVITREVISGSGDPGYTVRLLSGNFDQDLPQELLLAWYGNGYITISLYEVDGLSQQLVELATLGNIPLNNLGRSTRFDIAVGDFDGDRMDEIVLIRNLLTPYFINMQWVATEIKASVYDYDWKTQTIIPACENQFYWEVDLKKNFSGNISIGDLKLDRLVVTTGDFDGDMQDEAVLGFRLYFWEYEYDHPELMYRTFAYEYLLPFSINGDLTHLEFDPANRYWGYGNPTLKQWDGPPPESTTGSNLCLVSGDLNGDTRDEIVFRRGCWLSTFEASNSLNLNRILNDYWPFIDWNFESHRTLAITDLDADSTALDWQPEIFWLEFADDSRNMYIRVGKPVLDANNQITSILWITTSQPVKIDDDYFLTAVDMDGDAIKLGKPKRILKESVFQPIVVLNSPPVHFDILNNQPYDICLAFNANAPSCLFNSRYGTVAGTGTEVQTNVHADWGVSASLSGGFKPLGIVVNANLGAKYGEGFSKIATLQNEITITSEASAKQDDRIYTQEVDYSLWEYPIYCQGEKKGNLLAVFPHLTNESWFPAKQDDPGRHFLLRHETGNILSYPYYSNPLNNPEVDTLIGVDIERTVAADYTTPMLWGVSMQYLNISQVDTTKEVGLSVGLQ